MEERLFVSNSQIHQVHFFILIFYFADNGFYGHIYDFIIVIIIVLISLDMLGDEDRM
jgi:hypothetical protein